jgi:nickel-type superoxide dismutase maturation protease
MVDRFLKFLLKLLPYQVFTIQGKSMEPTLKEGTTLVVKKTKKVKLQDIIALYHPQDQRIIVKRLVRITNTGYFVKGDNSDSSTDSRNFGVVNKERIIGKIVATC